MKYKNVKLAMQFKDGAVYSEIEISTGATEPVVFRSTHPLDERVPPDAAYSHAMDQAALTLHAFFVNASFGDKIEASREKIESS